MKKNILILLAGLLLSICSNLVASAPPTASKDAKQSAENDTLIAAIVSSMSEKDATSLQNLQTMAANFKKGEHVDPKAFDQEYFNIGYHFRKKAGPSRGLGSPIAPAEHRDFYYKTLHHTYLDIAAVAQLKQNYTVTIVGKNITLTS